MKIYYTLFYCLLLINFSVVNNSDADTMNGIDTITTKEENKVYVLDTNTLNRICNAIYRIEGGSVTHYPYGIKIYDKQTKQFKHYTQEEAKRICENTIRNNYDRWNRSSKKEDFYTYLANRYCPPSSDKIGNGRWNKNINSIMSK